MRNESKEKESNDEQPVEEQVVNIREFAEFVANRINDKIAGKIWKRVPGDGNKAYIKARELPDMLVLTATLFLAWKHSKTVSIVFAALNTHAQTPHCFL